MRTPQFKAGRDGKLYRQFPGVDYAPTSQPTAKVQQRPEPSTPLAKLYQAFDTTTAIAARSAPLPTPLAKRDQPATIQQAVMAKLDAAVAAVVAPLAEQTAALAMRVARLETDQRAPAQIYVLRR
jgi:hypothetical protein